MMRCLRNFRTLRVVKSNFIRPLSTGSIRLRIADQLTDDFKVKLAGNITSKKFKLAAIVNEVDDLEEVGFPLPDSLSEDQWKILMSFDHRETRARYLAAILENQGEDPDHLEEIRQREKELTGPLVLDQAMVDRLVGSDEVRKSRIEDLKRVHEAMLMEGKPVLPFVTEETLRSVLETETLSRIVSALTFLVTKEGHKYSKFIQKKVKKVRGDQIHKERMEERAANDHIIYGIGQNSILQRINQKKMEKVDDFKVIREYHPWGQPLVIDLSFVKFLTHHQAKSLFYRELHFGLKANRETASPLAVYLTSYDPKCYKCQILEKALPRVMDDNFPAIVTEKSYMDLFPNQRLLYLSPDSRNDLMQHDPDDVYIVGGIMDAGSTVPVPKSISTAKKLGIRHARFPTKRFTGMQVELNVDQAMAIIADFKNHRDWFYAFRWIPPRFFRNRLKSSKGYSVELEAIYHAHLKMSPNMGDCSPEILQLTPKKYKAQYKELIEQFTQENGGVKKKFDDAYHQGSKKIKFERKYGFLELM